MNEGYPVPMHQVTPRERDAARSRVGTATTTTAVVAGLLAVGGAVAAASTFAGRTVSASTTQSPSQDTSTAPTFDPGSGLQQPVQPPSAYQGGGNGGGVPTGGS